MHRRLKASGYVRPPVSEMTRKKLRISLKGINKGPLNIMSKKTILEIWIEKYGEDEARRMWIESYERRGETHSRSSKEKRKKFV